MRSTITHTLTGIKDADTQQPFSHNLNYTVTVGTLDGEPVVVTPAGTHYEVEVYDDFKQAVDRAMLLGWDPDKANPPTVKDVD